MSPSQSHDYDSSFDGASFTTTEVDKGLRSRILQRLELCRGFPILPVIDASTDPGDDNDDVLKVVAAAYFQLTTLNQVASIIERGPVKERALLMRGVMDSLVFEGVELGVGSHYSYGSGPMHVLAQSMMKNKEQAFVRSSELLKEILQVARPRSLTLLCIGGLKDLCETVFLEPLLIQEKVSQIVFMGGVVTLQDRLSSVEPSFQHSPPPEDLDDPVYELAFGRSWRKRHPGVDGTQAFGDIVYLDEQGRMTADPRAANNKFDYNSATAVYTAMQTWGIPMIIYTRHAAEAMSFPREFYDELAESTKHPVAEYLRDFQRDILKMLWWRTWQDGLAREGLPAACTPAWFGQKFCGDSTVAERISSDQDPWEYVKRFAPYDVGAFFAADPHVRANLYDPDLIAVGGQTHLVIGTSQKRHGIKNVELARKFFSDVIRGGFERVEF